jgi:putative restriction endonuclease
VKAFVAVTDNDWFRFLRARPELDEVNFWQPGGGRQFRALELGQPFLFKLHHPENFIVGGGFYTHFSLLPATIAWEAFGEKNGAASFGQMRERIEQYRRVPMDPHANYTIGCIILQDPFFLERRDWLAPPEDFSPNIVVGKTYDLRSSPGRELWEAVQARRAGGAVRRVAEAPVSPYGEPRLVRQRIGQGTFRVLVTDTYGRRCAVTREKALPVLQAAHIRPVSEGGAHRVDNGLLLRSDVHTLFDRGYLTVTPTYTLRVSRRLRDDFDNGEHYYQYEKAALWVPERAEDRPSREFLEWHGDTVFRA